MSTINLRISALRAWCGWMTEQGILSADPAAHVKLIGGEGSSKRSGLKSAQINALLRQAQLSRDKERNYAIVQILLQTGIRLSECAALTFEDLTFGERSGLLRVRAGKGNKTRSVPLNASAREAIAIYMAPRLGIEKPSLKGVASKVAETEITRGARAHLPEPEGRSTHNFSDGTDDCRLRTSGWRAGARRDKRPYVAPHFRTQLLDALSWRCGGLSNVAWA